MAKNAQVTLPAKTKGVLGSPGTDEGQMKGHSMPEKFADPLTGPGGFPNPIKGMEGTYADTIEKSGFITTGYLDKQGTPYGEAAKFNFLPPGMDISNQENAEIHSMPLKMLTAESYPGDGWMPSPRDIPE